MCPTMSKPYIVTKVALLCAICSPCLFPSCYSQGGGGCCCGYILNNPACFQLTLKGWRCVNPLGRTQGRIAEYLSCADPAFFPSPWQTSLSDSNSVPHQAWTCLHNHLKQQQKGNNPWGSHWQVSIQKKPRLHLGTRPPMRTMLWSLGRSHLWQRTKISKFSKTYLASISENLGVTSV